MSGEQEPSGDAVASDPRLIRLGPDDNVLVLSCTLGEGERVSIGGTQVQMARALSLGHKVAARRIAAGESVVKYGAPIGVATADIAPGEHVHVHNVRSAYTPTYVLPEEPC